mmetsp:Transcript_14779/g.43410  ORF Transcript_14779/g.43410 Transcript_14779/m.43410 type:complete len:243 (+) Transcript_14779:2154-2882(+)
MPSCARLRDLMDDCSSKSCERCSGVAAPLDMAGSGRATCTGGGGGGVASGGNMGGSPREAAVGAQCADGCQLRDGDTPHILCGDASWAPLSAGDSSSGVPEPLGRLLPADGCRPLQLPPPRSPIPGATASDVALRSTGTNDPQRASAPGPGGGSRAPAADGVANDECDASDAAREVAAMRPSGVPIDGEAGGCAQANMRVLRISRKERFGQGGLLIRGSWGIGSCRCCGESAHAHTSSVDVV